MSEKNTPERPRVRKAGAQEVIVTPYLNADRLLTLEEAAAALALDGRKPGEQVRNIVRGGGLAYVRVQNKIRIHPADLRAYVERQRQPSSLEVVRASVCQSDTRRRRRAGAVSRASSKRGV